MTNNSQCTWNAKETFWIILAIIILTSLIGSAITSLSVGWLVGSLGNYDEELSRIAKSEKDRLLDNYDYQMVSTGIISILTTLFIYLFAKAKCKKPLADYFALAKLPKYRHSITFILLYISYSILVYIAYQLFDLDDDTQYMSAFYNMDYILIGFLYVCLIAPIGEELLYRGFLYKGWSTSKLGVHGSILIISVLFVVMHAERYEFETILLLFPPALILGYARYISGTLCLPIFIHVLNNTFVSSAYFV